MIRNIHQSDQGFSYTYSARQQEDVQAIRQKYLPKEEDKMAQLRKLDRNVTLYSTIPAVLLGIIGALLLGIGICCVTIESWSVFLIPGIVSGIIGLLIMVMAYPLYIIVLKRKQAEAAPQILRLSEEIMKH
jgi:hypothetical protein